MYEGLRKEKKISQNMTKIEKFFKRLPHTTFFDPEFIGNKLDKKLIENVKNKDIEAIKHSIKIGANVNARDENGKTGLMIACEKGNFEIVNLLINEYAKLDLRDNKGRTALHYACLQSNLRIVTALFTDAPSKRRLKRRINRRDKQGNTPLHLAVLNNHYYTINHLLLSGANKRIKNKEGKDVYNLAESCMLPKITLLLRKF